MYDNHVPVGKTAVQKYSGGQMRFILGEFHSLDDAIE